VVAARRENGRPGLEKCREGDAIFVASQNVRKGNPTKILKLPISALQVDDSFVT
jgi:hypothetical protein